MKPNYKLIFSDIIKKRYPEKKRECLPILSKRELSAEDIIILNKKLFGLPDKETQKTNQKHRSYNESDIVKMLEYQKTNTLSNIQLAKTFGLSRNTVAKWKKMFQPR